MKAVVTGGAGFIGSHLAERLLNLGHDVVVIDNLSTGSAANISGFEKLGKFTFVEADLNGPKPLDGFFSGADWVFHVAGLADVMPSIERPFDYFKANVEGTLSALELSRRAKVKRFIYTASSSCYGATELYPTPETAPINPLSPYALTKRMGEELALSWSVIYGLPAVSLRLFNVYGPRAKPGGAYGSVFSVFLAQRAHNRPLTIVGDGNQSRDFTYVTDVAEAFIAAAQSNVSGEAFNIGSGQGHAVIDIVDLIGGSERVYLPKRPGEPDKSLADTSKASRALGWHANTPFNEGVRVMLGRLNDWLAFPPPGS